MLSEWRIDPGTSRPNPNEMTDFNIFTMNSKAFPGTAPLVVKLGERYLRHDGASLLHGDLFPGSLLQIDSGELRVIDPEFCIGLVELMPEQPYVLNYLGYTWIDRGENLEEGMELLQRALKQRHDDGAITDSVGWAFYRLGQYDKAVEWLERAAEQKGDDATIIEHLGDAYWHVGRKREARFQWERALNQKPDKDRLGVIRDKLDNGLSAANDKPTVYEKPAEAKQGG